MLWISQKKGKSYVQRFPTDSIRCIPLSAATGKADHVRPSCERDAYKELKLKTHSKDSFSIGKETVDLRYIKQLADQDRLLLLGNC